MYVAYINYYELTWDFFYNNNYYHRRVRSLNCVLSRAHWVIGLNTHQRSSKSNVPYRSKASSHFIPQSFFKTRVSLDATVHYLQTYHRIVNNFIYEISHNTPSSDNAFLWNYFGTTVAPTQMVLCCVYSCRLLWVSSNQNRFKNHFFVTSLPGCFIPMIVNAILIALVIPTQNT